MVLALSNGPTHEDQPPVLVLLVGRTHRFPRLRILHPALPDLLIQVTLPDRDVIVHLIVDVPARALSLLLLLVLSVYIQFLQIPFLMTIFLFLLFPLILLLIIILLLFVRS